MHLDVKNVCSTAHLAQHYLGTNFSHPQLFSQYQKNGFPVHIHFITNHSNLIVERIDHVLFPVLCCHLSVLQVVRCAAYLQQGFCLQETFYGDERLVLLGLHHPQRPAVVFHMLRWHYHRVSGGGGRGMKMAPRCVMSRATISMARFTDSL
jgi:hypothetical protein